MALPQCVHGPPHAVTTLAGRQAQAGHSGQWGPHTHRPAGKYFHQLENFNLRKQLLN